MNFANQTVVVTGGTGALGRAVVGTLLTAGARCRVPYVVEVEAAAFPHKDRVTLIGHCELTNEDDVARLYHGIDDLWASIHIAGGFAMGAVADTNKAGMLDMLNTNFVTCYLCSRAAVQNFGPAGGRIVNISARAWHRATDRCRHGTLRHKQGRHCRLHPGPRRRGRGAGHPGQRRRAINHRHARQSRRDAKGRSRRMAKARRNRRHHRLSGVAGKQSDDRRRGTSARKNVTRIVEYVLNCRTVELSNCRTVELSNCRTGELSNW